MPNFINGESTILTQIKVSVELEIVRGDDPVREVHFLHDPTGKCIGEIGKFGDGYVAAVHKSDGTPVVLSSWINNNLADAAGQIVKSAHEMGTLSVKVCPPDSCTIVVKHPDKPKSK